MYQFGLWSLPHRGHGAKPCLHESVWDFILKGKGYIYTLRAIFALFTLPLTAIADKLNLRRPICPQPLLRGSSP